MGLHGGGVSQRGLGLLELILETFGKVPKFAGEGY